MMPVSSFASVDVTTFTISDLMPGESLRIRGRKLTVKGTPSDIPIEVTVVMTNRFHFNDGNPFPGIVKITGIAIISSDTKLLQSSGPSTTNWAAIDVIVDQKWNVAAGRSSARAIYVDTIAVIHS